ncbi:MAG TPA: DUF5995 family protein [Thermoanaerobaculia bacterium]|nr:DUF5995 family protein [Thermoanaerobaculia bacterium]
MPPLPPITNIASIDDVLAAIDGIIAWSIANTSRLGYFAALYKRITAAIKVNLPTFQDPARLERLDVTFASRYFAALNAWFHPEQFGPLSVAWRVAFEGAAMPQPIIVQHLIAGVNAHIDLDLGIAAEQTSPGALLPSLHDDFIRVNTVLSNEVHAVLAEIDELSPALAKLYDVLMQFEIDAINRVLEITRNDAWAFALLLAFSPSLLDRLEIAKRDLKVSLLGRLVLNPPTAFALIIDDIGRVESRDIVHNIEVLNAQANAMMAANGMMR